ncbi:MAG: hypothetical protein ABI192_13020 [Bradyrhizobium sp.]
MQKLSMLAASFDDEVHFPFLRFFFMMSAWARKASAKVRIWSATKLSADRNAVRSATRACFRKAFAILLMLLQRKRTIAVPPAK